MIDHGRRECLALLASAVAMPRVAVGASARRKPLFRRGLNFHGILNWPSATRSGDTVTYAWPPFSEPRYALRESVMRDVKAAGFDFVRLTVSPDIFLASDPTRRRQLFEIARIRLDQIAAAGLSVLVDFHPIVLNPDFTPDKILESSSAPAFKAYVDLVRQVATFLKDMDQSRIAFELMNEPSLHRPADMNRWPPMLAQLHDTARAAAPDLTLVLSGAKWSDRLALEQIDPARYKGSKVIYTFHYYDPHVYTHQGYPREEDVRYVSELAWPSVPDNIRQVRAAAQQRIEQDSTMDPSTKSDLVDKTSRTLDTLANGHFDQNKIATDFARLAQWGRTHGIEPGDILLGEFGALATSAGVASPGRHLWIETVRRAAEKTGFIWAFWAYEKAHEFGLATASGGLDPDVLSALGLKS